MAYQWSNISDGRAARYSIKHVARVWEHQTPHVVGWSAPRTQVSTKSSNVYTSSATKRKSSTWTCPSGMETVQTRPPQGHRGGRPPHRAHRHRMRAWFPSITLPERAGERRENHFDVFRGVTPPSPMSMPLRLHEYALALSSEYTSALCPPTKVVVLGEYV